MQEGDRIAQFLINDLKNGESEFFSGENTLKIRKRIRKYRG
jgi:hypothetical protein